MIECQPPPSHRFAWTYFVSVISVDPFVITIFLTEWFSFSILSHVLALSECGLSTNQKMITCARAQWSLASQQRPNDSRVLFSADSIKVDWSDRAQSSVDSGHMSATNTERRSWSKRFKLIFPIFFFIDFVYVLCVFQFIKWVAGIAIQRRGAWSIVRECQYWYWFKQ